MTKMLLLLLCVTSLARAQNGEANSVVGQRSDGTMGFAFQTNDGHERSEAVAPDGSVRGSYSYTSPDGSLVSVRYIADERGFRILDEKPSVLPLTRSRQPVDELNLQGRETLAGFQTVVKNVHEGIPQTKPQPFLQASPDAGKLPQLKNALPPFDNPQREKSQATLHKTQKQVIQPSPESPISHSSISDSSSTPSFSNPLTFRNIPHFPFQDHSQISYPQHVLQNPIQRITPLHPQKIHPQKLRQFPSQHAPRHVISQHGQGIISQHIGGSGVISQDGSQLVSHQSQRLIAQSPPSFNVPDASVSQVSPNQPIQGQTRSASGQQITQKQPQTSQKEVSNSGPLPLGFQFLPQAVLRAHLPPQNEPQLPQRILEEVRPVEAEAHVPETEEQPTQPVGTSPIQSALAQQPVFRPQPRQPQQLKATHSQRPQPFSQIVLSKGGFFTSLAE